MTVARIKRGLRRKSSKVLPGSKKIVPKVAGSEICGGSLTSGGEAGGGGASHSSNLEAGRVAISSGTFSEPAACVGATLVSGKTTVSASVSLSEALKTVPSSGQNSTSSAYSL